MPKCCTEEIIMVAVYNNYITCNNALLWFLYRVKLLQNSITYMVGFFFQTVTSASVYSSIKKTKTLRLVGGWVGDNDGLGM